MVKVTLLRLREAKGWGVGGGSRGWKGCSWFHFMLKFLDNSCIMYTLCSIYTQIWRAKLKCLLLCVRFQGNLKVFSKWRKKLTGHVYCRRQITNISFRFDHASRKNPLPLFMNTTCWPSPDPSSDFANLVHLHHLLPIITPLSLTSISKKL